MSHPEGYDPRLTIRRLLRTLGMRGKLNSKIDPPDPILGGRGSIVVTVPAHHAGDPGSIPGNGAMCGAIYMSHPEAYARKRRKRNSNIGPWTQYREVVVV